MAMIARDERSSPDEDLLRVVARFPRRWSRYAVAAAAEVQHQPRLAEEWANLLDELDTALSKALPPSHPCWSGATNW